MDSQERKSGILRKTSNWEINEQYLSEYEDTYPTTETFEKVTDIEGKVTVLVQSTVQSEEHGSEELDTVLPVAQQREVQIKFIPDFDTVQYNYTGTVGSITKFTTVSEYTEVFYYAKSTLEYASVLGNKQRSSGKSLSTSSTGTSTSVVERIFNCVRYIVVRLAYNGTGSTETKVYTTRKPRNSTVVTTYIGTDLDTLVVNPTEVVPSTKKFIFPSAVVQYCKSPYQYFVSTLQYCIDTCSVPELREWVKGLYGNCTTRKWLYYLNRYPKARSYLPKATQELQSLVTALSTVYIFGYPLPIVKKNSTGHWYPVRTNENTNKIVGTYFNFPTFKSTTTQLQKEYIEGLKRKEFTQLKFNTTIAQHQVDSFGYVHIKYAGRIICSKLKRKAAAVLAEATENLERQQKKLKTEYLQSAYV